MKGTKSKYFIALALFCVLGTGLAWPQAGTGELTGLVTDPTGAVIVGAAVELTNDATGTTRSTVTSAGGIYRFVSLPIVGKYTLSLKQSGSKQLKESTK
jgi:hypothetical protein